jgi:DNA polymerase I-like protein with 3'-5' exonuclease and polymerase domains
LIARTQDQLNELKLWITQQDQIIVDIETTGLSRRQDRIIGIGFASRGTAYYLPTFSWNAICGELVPEVAHETARDILGLLAGKKLACHNAAFDLAFIREYFKLDLVQYLHLDTMLLAHTLDENKFSYRLKDLAKQEFGPSVVSEQADMYASIAANGGDKQEFFKADMSIMAAYCMQDCLLTERLADLYLPQLCAEGLEAFFFEQEIMPHYREVTIPMEAAGIRMDMPLVRQALTEITADLVAVEAEILAAIQPLLGEWKTWRLNLDYPPKRTGAFAEQYALLHNLPLPRTKSGGVSLAAKGLANLPDSHAKAVLLAQAYMMPEEVTAVQEALWAADGSPGFNLQSGHHLKKLFFDTLKETPLSKTKTGMPQCDDDFLELMASKYEWAAKLRTFNRLRKIKSTYIERFLEQAEGGRFYASYKEFGTVTGRLSGDFQQLPRQIEDDSNTPAVVLKYVNQIRNFFIADEGAVLIDADYESLEPHVFAHISKDPAIIEIFNSKQDFYSKIAIKSENLHQYSADKKADNYLGKIAKGVRQKAKAYALGAAYGLTDFKLAHDLNIPQEEAAKIISGYWSGFPVLKQVSDSGKEHILQHGFIASEVGRRRRLQEAKTIADKHGKWILNSLDLWKEYKDRGGEYDHMKIMRRRLNNALNASINFPTQSLAGSIIKRASIATMRAYKAAGLSATIVANIHDEILVSCAEHEQAEAAKILQNCMENTYKLRVQLKAEPNIGKRYGEIK